MPIYIFNARFPSDVILLFEGQIKWLYPANMTHLSNVGLMLGQRHRRWPNIKPTLLQCVVFAG